MSTHNRVEFYYDYGSPTAYLAWTQLPGLCRTHGAELAYRPILLGGIFKRGDGSRNVEVNETERIVQEHKKLFDSFG